MTERLFLLCMMTVAMWPVQRTHAIDYKVTSNDDGRIIASSSPRETSLRKQHYLMNTSNSPVQITTSSITQAFTESYDRAFESQTSFSVTQPVFAIKIRTVLYDVFGEHLINMENTEVKDFTIGDHVLTGQVRVSRKETTSHLTSVTFVAQARMADGSQWRYDEENLVAAMASLGIGRDAE